MNKRVLRILTILIVILCSFMFLLSCNDKEDNSWYGTYYLYINDMKIESTWIKLEGNEWRFLDFLIQAARSYTERATIILLKWIAGFEITGNRFYTIAFNKMEGFWKDGDDALRKCHGAAFLAKVGRNL